MSRTEATLTTVEQFNEALMTLMTDDCIFENTWPAPDGTRYAGQAAVRAFWEGMLRDSPQARFTTEEIFGVDDRCVVRWRYDYTSADGTTGHIRGVDIIRVRDGQVAEKLSYVKG